MNSEAVRARDGAAGWMEIAMPKVNALRTARRFISDESGQDLTEYALLLAFVALASAAILLNMNSSANTIWTVVNNHLAAANSLK